MLHHNIPCPFKIIDNDIIRQEEPNNTSSYFGNNGLLYIDIGEESYN